MPFLRIQDQSLYYTLTPGNGDIGESGPVLLFVHGLGSSSSFYATIIPELAALGFTCLAFDTPGSGLSPYPGHDAGVVGIAEYFGKAVAQLGISMARIIAIGHSMGAIIASRLALHHELLGVVLIGPVNPSPSLGDIFANRIKTVEKEGMDAMADTIPLAATGPGSNATQRAFIRALLLAQTPEGYNSLCRAIVEAEIPQYSKINSALLILCGSHDKTSPLASAQSIQKEWGSKQKDLEILDQVGHWHCIEAAEQVSTSIGRFAKQLVPAPAV